MPAERDGAAGVLAGVRVVEVAQGWAGPAAAMYLADQGAEVVKVEPPGGDLARGWYPSPVLHGTSRSFLAVNRNKRSIVVDLRTDDGRAVVADLVGRADVVVVNLDPATADRLGVGASTLMAANERLVYAAVSGWGDRGPMAGRAAFDQVLQGVTGAMDRRMDDGTPLRAGTWVADTSAPMLLAYGVALALLDRERTGRGQQVGTSLLEAAVALQLPDLVRVAADPELASMNARSSGLYRCADDRWINVATFTERQVVALLTTLGLEELLTSEEFLAEARDLTLLQRLWREQLVAAFATRSAGAWLATLADHDVPCGLVRTRSEVFDDPQVVASGVFVPVDQPGAGRVDVAGVPVRLAGSPGAVRHRAPGLGEHTDEVLQELGYDAARVAALREAATVR